MTNFLDITLDNGNSTFNPYRKPGNTPLYVNMKSSHPPNILKQIPVVALYAEAIHGSLYLLYVQRITFCFYYVATHMLVYSLLFPNTRGKNKTCITYRLTIHRGVAGFGMQRSTIMPVPEHFQYDMPQGWAAWIRRFEPFL